MFVYLLMFGMALLAGNASDENRQRIHQSVWIVSLIFVMIIGLRFEVGGDWETYQDAFDRTQIYDLNSWQRISTDFGFSMVNYFSDWLSAGVYGVNLICAALLMAGIAKFAMDQPTPWLVFASATPYLIIVVGMGYTRQSVAVGFELIALTYLFRDRLIYFLLFMGFAALFHKSAIIVLPFSIFAVEKRQAWLWILVVGSAVVGGYYLFVAEYQDALWKNYVDAKYMSSGAVVRLAMTNAAAVFLFFFFRQLQLTAKETRFWLAFGVTSLLAYLVLPLSSTAVDRLALYLIPLQLFVCGRIQLAGQEFALFAVVSYFLALFVWMNYATHAFAWLPYQFAPFVPDL